jgi:prepilin-type processing-associated H-X9-DG protein
MNKRAAGLILALILALATVAVAVHAAPLTGDAVPPGIAATALGYGEALVAGDSAAAWSFLSAKTQSEIDPAQWRSASLQPPSPRPPSSNVLLRAISTAEPPASVGDILVRGGEAFVEVNDSIQITQELVLVKEGGRWLVDLAASDQLNARAAAEVFLEAVGSESGMPSGPRQVRTAQSSLPMLRAVLAPNAKDYRVLEADIEGDRARVTLACDIPVNLVLRAVRVGPGWTIDLTRPVVNIDPTAPNALDEAADEADRTACQDQLRKLGHAFQMYAAASEDILPQASTWADQIRPFLPAGVSLHCSADRGEGISYAMNSNLGGKKRGQIANPSNTPLLYESTLHTSNPAGAGEGWPAPAFHASGNMVLYADGSVRPAREKPSFDVTEAEAGAQTNAPARPVRPLTRPRPSRGAP